MKEYKYKNPIVQAIQFTDNTKDSVYKELVKNEAIDRVRAAGINLGDKPALIIDTVKWRHTLQVNLGDWVVIEQNTDAMCIATKNLTDGFSNVINPTLLVSK